MALHSGIDTVSFVSGGVYSETYVGTDTHNMASLFASYGMIEDAPEESSGFSGLRNPALFIIFKELVLEQKQRGIICQ